MRLPKFIRYIKCKERLVRYTVNIDLLTRERILNSHFSMLTEKFSPIHSPLVSITFISNSQFH